MKIAFKTKNTIKAPKIKRKTIDTYNLSRAYKLKCNKYPLRYIGQT
jgi:hypothetical protein